MVKVFIAWSLEPAHGRETTPAMQRCQGHGTHGNFRRRLMNAYDTWIWHMMIELVKVKFDPCIDSQISYKDDTDHQETSNFANLCVRTRLDLQAYLTKCRFAWLCRWIDQESFSTCCIRIPNTWIWNNKMWTVMRTGRCDFSQPRHNQNSQRPLRVSNWRAIEIALTTRICQIKTARSKSSKAQWKDRYVSRSSLEFVYGKQWVWMSLYFQHGP